MAALQYADCPGYSAMLFRRTYSDLSLPGALMDRANEWLRGTDARWNDQRKTWTFPSGATLSFGYMEGEADKYRYQGAEFQMVGFDELTQFTETQYEYLFSRLRRLEGVGIPLRMRSASNPGGVGHQWVKRRFIGEPREPGRVFISARLEDNPHLDQVAYETSLLQLDHVTRAQLRQGDWDILAAGNKFKREWFEIVPVVPADCKRVRFWDLAATEPKPGQDPDFSVGALVGFDGHGKYYMLDVQRTQATPAGVEALVRQTAQLDGVGVTIAMEQEPGSSGKALGDHYRRNVLQGYAFYPIPSTGSKEVRANPVSAQAEAGNVKLLEGKWNGPLLDELALFPMAGVHDDQVDAVSGAFGWLSGQLAGQGEVKVYIG